MDLLTSAMTTMEIPPDTSSRYSYLQLYGNRQLKLQNYIRIIDYDQNRLLLQCKTCKLDICGSCLEIQLFSRQELIVNGVIEKISFL